MTGIEALKAITDNLSYLLKNEGITFGKEHSGFEKKIAASALPCGTISYAGETFEYVHGQRPGFAEADFAIKVYISSADAESSMADAQSWVHRIRTALTCNALNTGSLAQSKNVSRVDMREARVRTEEKFTIIECQCRVRYR